MNNETKKVFACAMCGLCCTGEGGIVLAPRDLARLAKRFNMVPEAFLAEYAVRHNGKLKIRTGLNGKCVFFQDRQGCTVHDDKPAVCKAWPFFRGNMVDAESLSMAKDYCPGIRPDATHEEFVAEGRAYLQKHDLEASDPTCEANALLP